MFVSIYHHMHEGRSSIHTPDSVKSHLT